MSIEARHRIKINQTPTGIDIQSSVRYANGTQEDHSPKAYTNLDSARKRTIARTLAWMAIEKLNQVIETSGVLLFAIDAADIIAHNSLDLRHAVVGMGATAFSFIGNLVKKDSEEEAIRHSQLVQSLEQLKGSQTSSVDHFKPYVID